MAPSAPQKVPLVLCVKTCVFVEPKQGLGVRTPNLMRAHLKAPF